MLVNRDNLLNSWSNLLEMKSCSIDANKRNYRTVELRVRLKEDIRVEAAFNTSRVLIIKVESYSGRQSLCCCPQNMIVSQDADLARPVYDRASPCSGWKRDQAGSALRSILELQITNDRYERAALASYFKIEGSFSFCVSNIRLEPVPEIDSWRSGAS